jgi:hypothetical protein
MKWSGKQKKPTFTKCSHCNGVLEKHQLEHYIGCLCKCHKKKKRKAIARASGESAR